MSADRVVEIDQAYQDKVKLRMVRGLTSEQLAPLYSPGIKPGREIRRPSYVRPFPFPLDAHVGSELS